MSLPERLAAVVAAGDERLSGATSLAELREAQSEILGRKGPLAGINGGLGVLEPEQRREAGQLVNQARADLMAAAAKRRQVLEHDERAAKLASEKLDLTEALGLAASGAEPGRAARGHLHLVTRTRTELEDIFIALGYEIAEGPEAETDWYNFEALNMPPDHPARTLWDTLYLDLGEPGTVLLRTHTSPVQIHLMENRQPPIYAVVPGRCYRRDTPDARHLPVFHQIEGLVVDRQITFGDLAGTIDAFTTALFGPAMKSRLRPSFFPFTSRRPSST